MDYRTRGWKRTRGGFEVETPWGISTVEERWGAPLHAGYRIGRLSADTAEGFALIDLDVEGVGEPRLLRVTMTSESPSPESSGQGRPGSLAKVSVGWRFQAYLDPHTGHPSRGHPVDVRLSGPMPVGSCPEEARGRILRAALLTLAEGAEEDPTYPGRAYGSMALLIAGDIDAKIHRLSARRHEVGAHPTKENGPPVPKTVAGKPCEEAAALAYAELRGLLAHIHAVRVTILTVPPGSVLRRPDRPLHSGLPPRPSLGNHGPIPGAEGPPASAPSL